MRKLLRNARYLAPDLSIAEGDLLLDGDLIAQILTRGESPARPPDVDLNLEGYLIFPGLINAHDHLIEAFPGPAPTRPFAAWHEWEAHCKTSPAFRHLQRLSAADLYTLGLYRNALSGVTLVVDHFPREVRATFQGNPLVALLEHFFLAHSVSAHRLEWGQGIQEEFAQARGILPFILHVGEGTTQDLQEECESLNRLGALAENTVLVNPIGLQQAQLEVVAARRASLVWCPCSCQNVFGAHPPLQAAHQAGIRIALGTDRALSHPGLLFDDLRLARRLNQELLGGVFSDADLIRMVTSGAAEILGVGKGFGSIAPGQTANLLVFPAGEGSPFEAFFALTPGRVSMVIQRGGMVFGDEALRTASALDVGQYSECLVEDQPKILLGRPFHLLERIENKLEETVRFPFLPLFPGK
ncbi:MAG: S-adenosylhomocysteine deaminase [Candidatus Ozemobacter sibiricus]|jgi:cytosine/adenosine deaminase-related metal-dependent hydrolase|uniref:S-adenosylhomocysteine deaminase n=1 Tax=Candidatus Ozemobacter sibiricus TaxID=2268124 RepID=A0A367ZUC2_9BACT|nr:MAG: S-adenosylhomocysteine deaminase [Candidatus Ozemobacter sibiricus]